MLKWAYRVPQKKKKKKKIVYYKNCQLKVNQNPKKIMQGTILSLTTILGFQKRNTKSVDSSSSNIVIEIFLAKMFSKKWYFHRVF